MSIIFQCECIAVFEAANILFYLFFKSLSYLTSNRYWLSNKKEETQLWEKVLNLGIIMSKYHYRYRKHFIKSIESSLDQTSGNDNCQDLTCGIEWEKRYVIIIYEQWCAPLFSDVTWVRLDGD